MIARALAAEEEEPEQEDDAEWNAADGEQQRDGDLALRILTHQLELVEHAGVNSKRSACAHTGLASC